MKTIQITTIFLIISIFFACNEKRRTDNVLRENKQLVKLDTSLPSCNEIVAFIEKGNRLESDFIGIAGLPSELWEKYIQLKKVATIDQLIMLTEHKCPAVRCYAFQALASRNSDKTFPILLKHLYDTSTVLHQSGCSGLTYYVGDYYVGVVTPGRIENDIYKLNQYQKQILDSVLINDKAIALFARSSAIEDLEPSINNYARIRQLVKEERNTSALLTLAKYKKQSDKALIASFFKQENTVFSVLSAVREYPESYFYPYVKKVFEKEWSNENYDRDIMKICYQTLAKYPKPETISIFERTIKLPEIIDTKDVDAATQIGDRHEMFYKYLCIAITKYPNELYEPIKEKIILNDFQKNEIKLELQYDY